MAHLGEFEPLKATLNHSVFAVRDFEGSKKVRKGNAARPARGYRVSGKWVNLTEVSPEHLWNRTHRRGRDGEGKMKEKNQNQNRMKDSLAMGLKN